MLTKITTAIIDIIIGRDEPLTTRDTDTSGRPMAHAQEKVIRNALKKEQRDRIREVLVILQEEAPHAK